MRITSIGVRYSQIWSPKSFESISSEVQLTAALNESESVDSSIKFIQEKARSYVVRDAAPLLEALGRVLESAFLKLIRRESVLGLDNHQPEAEWDSSVECQSCSVKWMQRWQTRQYESLASELQLTAELEPGESFDDVVPQLLEKARQAVKDDARPYLIDCGRIRPSQKLRRGGTEIELERDKGLTTATEVETTGGTQLWV